MKSGPIDLTICNQRGLHARAAAKFVKLAGDYEADITVTKDGTSVTGTSIMGLMMLAAAKGTSIRVEAKGPQAEDALQALSGLVAGGFDEFAILEIGNRIAVDVVRCQMDDINGCFSGINRVFNLVEHVYMFQLLLIEAHGKFTFGYQDHFSAVNGRNNGLREGAGARYPGYVPVVFQL